MATHAYPLMYIFENSVREFISRVLRVKHGNSWWDTAAPKDVKQEVERRRQRESKNPWHGKRGAHSIFYTDLDHLARIVTANWQDFALYLPNQQWLTQKLDETTFSRNVVAHNNPLADKDIKRVEVFLSDWQDLMRVKVPLLPG